MLNRIFNFLRDIDEFILSIPFLLCWPVHVWNWAAHAEQVPLGWRHRMVSISFGGFGVLLMCAPVIILDPGMRSLTMTLGLYMGWGIQSVCDGIHLSRKYRPTPNVEPEQINAP